jgi:hypothetical protein
MTPVYYLSGASAPADLRGLARIRHPLGVSIPELSEPALDEVCSLRGICDVFVDTAAFSEVDESCAVVSPILDPAWVERTRVMHRIAVALGAGAVLVAPDRVGDQQETLRRLALFADVMRACAALGARIVVPIQRGALSPTMFDDCCTAVLGCEFIRGIPGNKAAMPTGVLETYLRARRPAAVHLLGVGPRGQRYQALVDVLRRFVPGAAVSCDSNGLAAIVGRTNGRRGAPRALTAWQAHFEGRSSPVATWSIGPAEPSACPREDAVVMTLGPELIFRRFVEAHGDLLGLRHQERPLQLGLFDTTERTERRAE